MALLHNNFYASFTPTNKTFVIKPLPHQKRMIFIVSPFFFLLTFPRQEIRAAVIKEAKLFVSQKWACAYFLFYLLFFFMLVVAIAKEARVP